MRNEILRELQEEYKRQREEDAREEDRRLAEASAKCPALSEALKDRQALIYDGLRGVLDGTGRADDLPRRMEALNRRVESLLTQNGFPADYLDPVYRCATCRDTGYVGETVREMCPCMQGRFYARLYERIGLRGGEEESFEGFRAEAFPETPLPGRSFSQREMMRAIRNECEKWADRYPDVPARDVLLMGQSGLGKTFLMHAMAKRLLSRGFRVLVISAYRFLEIARKAYFGQGAEEMDDLLEAQVLMVDDMGTEPLMENITIIQWYNLLNERRTCGLGTVVSTNLMPEDLRQRYTERIASRLLDGKECLLVQFAGEDIRRRTR